MNDIKVSDVMTNLVVTLRPRDTIQEAARRLFRNRISGAPVVEEGRLAGVVSEADLMGAYSQLNQGRSRLTAREPLTFLLRGAAPRVLHDSTVAEVMTRRVVSISPEARVWEAASLMERHGVRRLPVVDPDRYVVGIVTRSDLVRAMARSEEDARPTEPAAG